MKMYPILMALPLFFCSCGSDSTTFNGSHLEPLQPAVHITPALNVDLNTDKALYKPGEKITFTASGTIPAGAKVRYRCGDEVIGTTSLTGNTWTWTAPSMDHTGYLTDIYTQDGDSAETVYGTVGVDVSINWAKYPRYGFVATYDGSKTHAAVQDEMAFLNRCHINGIQFYDWHYKHHWPLGGTRGNLMDSYTDIAERTVYTSVIKDYISTQHAYGMKSMFYNLCYGALDDAKEDGVSDKWHLYTDAGHATMDKLSMPAGWKSNIYLMDPANGDWQNYIADRNDDVYASLDFDGYHIDQVGDRGTVYDYYGSKLSLPVGFASFIRRMKARRPDKSLVMNAVSNFGSEQIAGTGDVDFLYSELWGGESKFSDLLSVMKANQSYNGSLGQVYAAYMDYNSTKPEFNAPGVLLTDAVMFALGADHLELGDHMLCNEYFPNSNLKMDDSLKKAIVHYYDFFTAYENLLRNGGTENHDGIYSGNGSVIINDWPPKLGTVTSYAKDVDGKEVINILNFVNANSLSWRDLDGSMPEPVMIKSLTLGVRASSVKKVWVASPDCYGGAPQQLLFRQEGDYVVFTVPSLKYWTMVVIEK
jgi:dextranase